MTVGNTDVGGHGLFWTLAEDFEGWSESVAEDDGLGAVRRQSSCGERPKGCVTLDGVGGEGKPNAWIYRTIALPADVTTLQFDTSAHNRDHADSFFRVRLTDESGGEHVLIDWTVTSGSEGVYHWSTRQVAIGAFAGQTVTLYFEGADNGPGIHEQWYYDEIAIY